MSVETLVRDGDPDAIRSRFRELRSELAGLITQEGPDALERRTALCVEVDQLDHALTMALAEQQQRQGPSVATQQFGSVPEIRSAGQMVADDEPFKAWIAGGANGNSPSVEVRDAREFRAVFEWNTTTGPPNVITNGVGSLAPAGQPIPPRPRQGRLVMRDLIPTQQTNLSLIPYVRELSPAAAEGGASAVAEGGTKPDVSILFQAASAPITVLAGNITVSKQVFDDLTTVMSYINVRLPYLVRVREDDEFLNGNGTWPNITGIRQTTGLQTQAATSGESAITIANAIAKVELVDLAASAVVLYPTDAWAMFTKRAAGGSGTFDAGTPFDNIPLTVWGLPTLRTRFMPSGKALVGDFSMGATIWDREQVNVQVYPQHSDYPIKNQLLLQAEERVGLSVERPDAFVEATL